MIQVIKKPLISEKNSLLAEAGVYTFEVDRRASKTDIKQAIEKTFKVKVSSVNTALCRNRGRRNRAGIGAPTYWKKAFVKLSAGEKIALFEGA